MFQVKSINHNSLLIILSIALLFTSIAIVKIAEEVTSPPRTKLGALVMEEPSKQNFLEWIYKNSPYFASSAWIAFGLTLMWKGRTRTIWRKYGYDMFSLLAKMRGSNTRVRILHSLSIAKTRLQLANELGLDWKAISRHTDVLIKHNLIEEVGKIRNAKYLIITYQGEELLELLERSQYSS